MPPSHDTETNFAGSDIAGSEWSDASFWPPVGRANVPPKTRCNTKIEANRP